ncbi:hypothetical protein GLAREA_07915 [Glarea lozoyensis ATCC 20868]|uniref:Uncharacterized protein n=1 Tax=Glarea lozoyensis (strain ATCC 20868 / MF5171) TaxID=1116229 RepID=S3DL93_GLAL2|nr:uncharacterized protein GLAREA_07915 [Glarea lozoyensis ATCC 20868]EPE32781.1 hypothetical protein GLAREA_07915 [Glarea lozoyensis ATCC 20868]
MSSPRHYQLQAEQKSSSRSSSSSSSSSSQRLHRPQPHTTTGYSDRSSTSSESSSASSSYYSDPYARASLDSRQSAPRVETLRCSRCAKCVETVVSPTHGGELRRVNSEDAVASGMVRFGHNLYYCERCARMVGYA